MRLFEDPLEELDLGQGAGAVPGLEAQIYLNQMDGAACAHGEDSLELDLRVDIRTLPQGVLNDTTSVEDRVVFRLACPEGFVVDNTEEPEPGPVYGD